MKKILTTKPAVVTIICLIVALQYSCKKDTTNTPAPKTKTELISQSSWKWTAEQFKKQDGSLVDQPLTGQQMSDVYFYNADGTFSTTRGTTVNTTGTWKLTSDTQIQLTFVDDTGTTVTPTFTFTVSATSFVMSIAGQFNTFDLTSGSFVLYYGQVQTFSH